MPDFPVSDSKRQKLIDRMAKLGIKKEDLEENFTRSGGPGGQNVNKVETCVVLKHTPSGIVVKYQVTRSQAFNRFMARRILADELEARQQGSESAKQQMIWRIRKQKQKRSKRAKLKMLELKRRRAQKKEMRGRVGPEDY